MKGRPTALNHSSSYGGYWSGSNSIIGCSNTSGNVSNYSTGTAMPATALTLPNGHNGHNGVTSASIQNPNYPNPNSAHSNNNNNNNIYNTSNSFIGGRKQKHYLNIVQFGRNDNWCAYAFISFVAIICYVNGMNGDFVHDDIPAITLNKDVIGTNKITKIFSNDFWGTPMADTNSHKSYRPLTVLSFR